MVGRPIARGKLGAHGGGRVESIAGFQCKWHKALQLSTQGYPPARPQPAGAVGQRVLCKVS